MPDYRIEVRRTSTVVDVAYVTIWAPSSNQAIEEATEIDDGTTTWEEADRTVENYDAELAEIEAEVEPANG